MVSHVSAQASLAFHRMDLHIRAFNFGSIYVTVLHNIESVAESKSSTSTFSPLRFGVLGLDITKVNVWETK